jgi:hypothetical protein
LRPDDLLPRRFGAELEEDFPLQGIERGGSEGAGDEEEACQGGGVHKAVVDGGGIYPSLWPVLGERLLDHEH